MPDAEPHPTIEPPVLEGQTTEAPRKTVALVEAEQRASYAWDAYGREQRRADQAERRATHAERHVRTLAAALSQWHDGTGSLNPIATGALMSVVADVLDVPAAERRPLEDEDEAAFDPDGDVAF